MAFWCVENLINYLRRSLRLGSRHVPVPRCRVIPVFALLWAVVTGWVAAQELSQIMALLPPDSRRRLIPDEAAETALLEQLTQEAVLSMAARLRGQST